MIIIEIFVLLVLIGVSQVLITLVINNLKNIKNNGGKK